MQQYDLNTSTVVLNFDSPEKNKEGLGEGQSGLCHSLEEKCKQRDELSVKRRKQRGQLVFEYILLLLVALSMAAIVRNTLTASSDDLDDSGLMIRMWKSLVVTVGEDQPVDPN